MVAQWYHSQSFPFLPSKLWCFVLFLQYYWTFQNFIMYLMNHILWTKYSTVLEIVFSLWPMKNHIWRPATFFRICTHYCVCQMAKRTWKVAEMCCIYVQQQGGTSGTPIRFQRHQGSAVGAGVNLANYSFNLQTQCLETLQLSFFFFFFFPRTHRSPKCQQNPEGD